MTLSAPPSLLFPILLIPALLGSLLLTVYNFSELKSWAVVTPDFVITIRALYSVIAPELERRTLK